MKKLFTAAALLCIIIANGQTKFDYLKSPSVPAASVFGYEESSIDRPQDPKAFASQIMGAFGPANITPGFAIEVNPYFTKSRTNYYLSDYLNKSIAKNYGELLAGSIGLSLATSQTDSFIYGKLKSGTGVSGGFRIQLLPGEVSAGLKKFAVDTLNYMNDVQTALAAITYTEGTDNTNPLQHDSVSAAKFFAFIVSINPNVADSFVTALKNTFAFTDSSERLASADVLDFFAQYQANNFLTLQSAAIKTATGLLPSARTGSMLEFSGAFSGVFSQNKLSQAAFGKAQLWLTYSYLQPINNTGDIDIDFMAIGRLTLNNLKDSVDVSHYIDAGTKIQFRYKSFYLSAEAIGRYAPNGSKFSYRATANIEYQVNQYLSAFVSVGRNFDGSSVVSTKNNGIFTVAGLNVGLPGLKAN